MADVARRAKIARTRHRRKTRSDKTTNETTTVHVVNVHRRDPSSSSNGYDEEHRTVRTPNVRRGTPQRERLHVISRGAAETKSHGHRDSGGEPKITSVGSTKIDEDISAETPRMRQHRECSGGIRLRLRHREDIAVSAKTFRLMRRAGHIASRDFSEESEILRLRDTLRRRLERHAGSGEDIAETSTQTLRRHQEIAETSRYRGDIELSRRQPCTRPRSAQ